MSLVGTRPILQDELRQYELHHRARIAIKPGITGMWQVSGRSDIEYINITQKKSKIPFRLLKMELTAVIKAHPEYLGERHKGETTLPILVKLIDARKDSFVEFFCA